MYDFEAHEIEEIIETRKGEIAAKCKDAEHHLNYLSFLAKKGTYGLAAKVCDGYKAKVLKDVRLMGEGNLSYHSIGSHELNSLLAFAVAARPETGRTVREDLSDLLLGIQNMVENLEELQRQAEGIRKKDKERFEQSLGRLLKDSRPTKEGTE